MKVLKQSEPSRSLNSIGCALAPVGGPAHPWGRYSLSSSYMFPQLQHYFKRDVKPPKA